MPLTLETNAEGNVAMNPMTGWELRDLAGVAVLLVVQYAETPAEIETGGKLPQFQVSVIPRVALEIGQGLTNLANRLLSQRPAGPLN